MNNIFKSVTIICATIIATVIFTSCDSSYTADSGYITSRVICDQFIVVSESKQDTTFGILYTVYDKDTKVMYYIMDSYCQAAMTPIYNSDGTVRIYSGEVT